MGFFSKVMNAASTTWKYVKNIASLPGKVLHLSKASFTVILPWWASIGKNVAGTGQYLFTLPKFVKYLTGKDNHPLNFYGSLMIVICSLIVNIGTRIPAIFRYFRPPVQHNLIELNVPPLPADNEGEMSRGGKSIYTALTVSCYLAVILNLLNQQLYSLALIEFVTQDLLNIDPHRDDREYYTQLLALTFATGSMMTYVIYTTLKAVPNGKILAENVTGKGFSWNRYTYLTLLSSVGVLVKPFLEYFSTKSALGKLPKISVPDLLVKMTAALSALVNSVAYVLTNIPAVYAGLTAHKNTSHYVNTPSWLKVGRWTVRAAGLGDGSAMAITNFIGFINTTHDLTDADPESCGVKAASILPVLSNTFLNYFFSVEQGVTIAYDNYHRDRGLLQQNTVEDINNSDAREAEDVERIPVFRRNSSTFYQTAFRPVARLEAEERMQLTWEP